MRGGYKKMKYRQALIFLMAALLAFSPLAAAAEPAQQAAIAQVDEVNEVEEGGQTQEPTPTPAPETGEDEPETGDQQTQVMYAKKNINLYKAQKTSSKVLDRIKKGDEITILSYGKNWCQAQYLGQDGYVRTTNLRETPIGPTPEPTPGPSSANREPSVPAARAATYYTKGEAAISVPAAEVITAFVLDYEGLGEGYFTQVFSLVNANIDALLSYPPQIPASLSKYEDVLTAVCQDMTGGLTLELSGSQLNSGKAKSTNIFTQTGSVIGAAALTTNEDGSQVLNFGTFTVKNVDKGTYYLQMPVKLSTASSLKALYADAETFTLIYPVKIAKMSTGGGGGGGGGGSSSKPLPVARLIVEDVHTEPESPQAGDVFDIVLTLRNTSESQYLRNMQITYTAEDDALTPTSGTNTEYIERIDAGSNYVLRLNVKAKPDLEVGSVKLDVSADFQDKELNALTASQSLVIPVKQVQRIQLDEPKLPTSTVIAGDSYEIEMGVFNLGKTMLYNVTVKAVPEDPESVSAGSSYYIGNMDPGSSKTAELELIPLTGGSFNANIEVTYETVDGQQQPVLTTPISFTVEEEEDYSDSDFFDYNSYEAEPVEPEPPTVTEVLAMLPWQIYLLAGGVVLMLVVWLGLALRRRRLRALEDDEMD